jgi:hypothetical protein
MAQEASAYAQTRVQIARDIIAQLQGLSDEGPNNTLSLPGTNTPVTPAAHTAGADKCWPLSLVGGRAIPCDRSAEFRAVQQGVSDAQA